jgi:hypothetical protein
VLKPIRESKIVAKDKKIVLWTEVVIDKNFPAQVAKKKFKYNTASKINDGTVPDVVRLLEGGLVINAPLV